VTVGNKQLGRGLGAALRRGVVLIPDRRDGIWLDGTASENVTLPVLRDLAGRFRMARHKQIKRTAALMEQFDVQPRSPTLPMSSFSGGNQQKLLLAKWLQMNPKVILLDSPTRGVDAGGRLAVLRMLRAAAADGCAAVVCSEDAEELIEVCDRILVLRDGTIIASLAGAEMSVARVLHVRETKG
jgi:ribose transport system ATP-binding protein